MKRLLAAGVVVIAAVIPLILGGKYVLHIATMVAIMSILALSMNLMLRIGQLSMAHGAFMGIGAYASALLTMRAGLPPMTALVISALGTGLMAIVLGFVILRIKGVFFVLVTYAFGQIVNLSFQEWTSLFGGNNGLYGIPKFAWFGIQIADASAYYILTLVFALASYAIVRAVFRSETGAILNCINEDEEFSRSLGVNALMWRTAVFGVSAALAAVSGSLYAHHLNFLSPSAFTFLRSVDVLVMNFVGGVSSAFGPVLGALIIVPLPEVLREAKEYELLAYGSILLLCLLFFKDGILGHFGRPKRPVAGPKRAVA